MLAIILQVWRISNPLYLIVDGQIELWHNPQIKGNEENEYICQNCQRVWK